MSSSPLTCLVIGTGGREHALARALSLDPGVGAVHAAPGNPGIAAVATLHDVDPLSGESVADLAESLGADLVVVGPEAPLVAGVADVVRARGIAVFGPSGAAFTGRPCRCEVSFGRGTEHGSCQGTRRRRGGRGAGAGRACAAPSAGGSGGRVCFKRAACVAM